MQSFTHAMLRRKLDKASGVVRISFFSSAAALGFPQLNRYSTNQAIKELLEYLLTATIQGNYLSENSS